MPDPSNSSSSSSSRMKASTARSSASTVVKLTVKPSENRGRTGQYTAPTQIKGYNYHVYVPKSYRGSSSEKDGTTTSASDERSPESSKDAPPKEAGLHLYLDGQGGCANNSNFRKFAKTLLEPYNLIGINMQFLDGNNGADVTGKLSATLFAVAQVQADYRIVAGRGIISSFSGGGLIHAGYWTSAGASKDVPDASWPFCHHTLYSSNWNVPMDPTPGGGGGGRRKQSPRMSWFLASGDRRKDNVWTTMTDVERCLLLRSSGGDSAPSGADRKNDDNNSPDCLLRITPDGDHASRRSDAAASADSFRRTDLVVAPFVRVADYLPRGGDLLLAAREANARRFREALRALDRISGGAEAPTVTGDDGGGDSGEARELRGRIERRVGELMSLSRELLAADPVLAEYYVPMILGQLKGVHPQEEELRAAYEESSRSDSYRNVLKLREEFARRFGGLMERKQGRVLPSQVSFLERCARETDEASLLGGMSRNILEFR